MSVVTVAVVPATSQMWPSLGRVFGPRGRDPDSCWCQRFRRHTESDNRSALQREISEADVPIGLLAVADDEIVGWTRVVPRETLPGITDNRALTRVLDGDPSAWWVSCLVIRREWRGQGIGVELLETAADWAFRNGASMVEGHPVDVDALASVPAPSAVFTGTKRLFERAGFTEIGRTYPSRPVMRRRGD